MFPHIRFISKLLLAREILIIRDFVIISPKNGNQFGEYTLNHWMEPSGRMPIEAAVHQRSAVQGHYKTASGLRSVCYKGIPIADERVRCQFDSMFLLRAAATEGVFRKLEGSSEFRILLAAFSIPLTIHSNGNN